jgi:hypothetical protein
MRGLSVTRLGVAILLTVGIIGALIPLPAAAKTITMICAKPMADEQFTIDYDAHTVTGPWMGQFQTVPAQFTDQTISWTFHASAADQHWTLERATGSLRLEDEREAMGSCREATNKF